LWKIQTQPNGPVQQEPPRIELWFKVMLYAFLPMGAAFVLPRAAMIPMFVVTGILMATGLVMLVIEERRGR
jgi:xanthine/uracil/vitamin C permease (AzgA family)